MRILMLGWLCAGALVAAMAQGPMRGVVTFIEPGLQFYINLGSHEQLSADTPLTVLRNGEVVGKAHVLKVNWLDAIAEMDRGTTVAPARGDTVVATQVRLHRASPDTLPAVEPDTSHAETEAAYSFMLLMALWLSLRHGDAMALPPMPTDDCPL